MKKYEWIAVYGFTLVLALGIGYLLFGEALR